jgi:hypothetical protein
MIGMNKAQSLICFLNRAYPGIAAGSSLLVHPDFDADRSQPVAYATRGNRRPATRLA